MLKKMSKKAKLIWGGAILIVLIGIIGNLAGGGTEKNNDDQAAAKTVATTAPAAFVLPDYTGKTLDVAMAEMTAHGVTAKSVDTVDGKTVFSPKNWTIESHSPSAGTSVAKGETVTFNVSKPGAAEAKATAEAEASKAAAEKAKTPTETSLGLDWSTASVACDHVGEDQFKYGFKAHWMVGEIAKRIESDEWFLKVEADITNAFGAKAKGVTIECRVGGTEEAPVVTEFNAY
jgi:hypothetical protein